MELKNIINYATLEDLVELYEKRGITVVIEDGKITEVHEDGC